MSILEYIYDYKLAEVDEEKSVIPQRIEAGQSTEFKIYMKPYTGDKAHLVLGNGYSDLQYSKYFENGELKNTYDEDSTARPYQNGQDPFANNSTMLKKGSNIEYFTLEVFTQKGYEGTYTYKFGDKEFTVEHFNNDPLSSVYTSWSPANAYNSPYYEFGTTITYSITLNHASGGDYNLNFKNEYGIALPPEKSWTVEFKDSNGKIIDSGKNKVNSGVITFPVGVKYANVKFKVYDVPWGYSQTSLGDSNHKYINFPGAVKVLPRRSFVQRTWVQTLTLRPYKDDGKTYIKPTYGSFPKDNNYRILGNKWIHNKPDHLETLFTIIQDPEFLREFGGVYGSDLSDSKYYNIEGDSNVEQINKLKSPLILSRYGDLNVFVIKKPHRVDKNIEVSIKIVDPENPETPLITPTVRYYNSYKNDNSWRGDRFSRNQRKAPNQYIIHKEDEGLILYFYEHEFEKYLNKKLKLLVYYPEYPILDTSHEQDESMVTLEYEFTFHEHKYYTISSNKMIGFTPNPEEFPNEQFVPDYSKFALEHWNLKDKKIIAFWSEEQLSFSFNSRFPWRILAHAQPPNYNILGAGYWTIGYIETEDIPNHEGISHDLSKYNIIGKITTSNTHYLAEDSIVHMFLSYNDKGLWLTYDAKKDCDFWINFDGDEPFVYKPNHTNFNISSIYTPTKDNPLEFNSLISGFEEGKEFNRSENAILNFTLQPTKNEGLFNGRYLQLTFKDEAGQNHVKTWKLKYNGKEFEQINNQTFLEPNVGQFELELTWRDDCDIWDDITTIEIYDGDKAFNIKVNNLQ